MAPSNNATFPLHKGAAIHNLRAQILPLPRGRLPLSQSQQCAIYGKLPPCRQPSWGDLKSTQTHLIPATEPNPRDNLELATESRSEKLQFEALEVKPPVGLCPRGGPAGATNLTNSLTSLWQTPFFHSCSLPTKASLALLLSSEKKVGVGKRECQSGAGL